MKFLKKENYTFKNFGYCFFFLFSFFAYTLHVGYISGLCGLEDTAGIAPFC